MSNEITAFFKGRVGVCESLYQYDYGMVMVLDNVDFGTVFDAYFQTKGEEDAIPVIGSNNRVAIPDSCLQKPGTVTVHIPVHTGLNDSEVEYIVRFKVIRRARPIYDGTPEESTAIAKAIAALQDIQGDVDAWLDNHPEATTSVQDGSLTEVKFANSLKLKAIKDYVTPQMYGAVADGVTDDTTAFRNALAAAPVVLVPSGKYKITGKIEITNKHRLLAIGSVKIYTYVDNDYAFWIHGETGSDYYDTNLLYDTYKGTWFGGQSGGMTLINSGDAASDAILFGINETPGDELYGMNAVAQIANVGFKSYRKGIHITEKNNYLNAFARLHFESCTYDVVFGTSGLVNSGELFKFTDCIFSTSAYAFLFNTSGWECSLINCSIDFCRVGFKDSNYNKIYMVNGHIEGVGKRGDDEYGILLNQGQRSMYTFTNVLFDISSRRGTTLFRGVGNLIITDSYISTAADITGFPGEYFLAEQLINLKGTLVGQEGYRQFLSQKNNLVPDALLSGATLDSSDTDITYGIERGYINGCTFKVVEGSMFDGQKSIRFTGTGEAPCVGVAKVTIPVTPLKAYNIGMALLKNHTKPITRAVSVAFYDTNDNKIYEMPEYLYSPEEPEKDVVYFPFDGRVFRPPAGTAYVIINFVVWVSPDSESLTSSEYNDIEFMYVEEW